MVEESLRALVQPVKIRWNRGQVTYDGPILRFSGEVTTSLGNTINNIVCVLVARAVADGRDLSSVNWDREVATTPLICEGDDSI